MSELTQSFIIRKLKSGEMVYLIRDIRNEAGDGVALLQVYSSEEGVYNPDWTVRENQPIISLEAVSSNGLSAPLASCLFTYDGEDILFSSTADANGWYNENKSVSRFAYKVENGIVKFRVIANLSNGDGINKTLSYRALGATQSNNQFTVYGSTDFLFPITSEGTYWVQMVTDNTTLGLKDGDTEITSANLSILCGKGTEDVENAVWDLYKNGVLNKSNLSIDETIHLTRDDVDGSEVFSAYLKVGNNIVAKDGLTIYDVADEYLVAYRTTSGDGTVSQTKSSTFQPYILRNLKEMSNPSGVQFINEVYNSSGDLVRTVNGDSITISASDCLFTQSGLNQYGDVEIRCTASW